MKNRMTIAAIAGICLVLLFVAYILLVPRRAPAVNLRFIGYTNNAAKLLSTTDATVAMFSVTNGSDCSIRDRGWYYICTSNNATNWAWRTYSPIGSPGLIQPHSSGTIVTRVPPNGVPWRVSVPLYYASATAQFFDGIRMVIDQRFKGKQVQLDFERYGEGAPTSNWIKP